MYGNGGITQTEEDGIDFTSHLAQSLPPAPQPPPATDEQNSSTHG